MSDGWWAEAATHPLLSVASHGWDHNHPDLGPDEDFGSFLTVDWHEVCRLQVLDSARLIKEISGVWPRYFAYPFGVPSIYLRETWFPEHIDDHGCRAALGTEPGPVTMDSDIWNLPRIVCGTDWANPGELLALLDDH